MREIRTSGSTRGSDGYGIASRQPPVTLYSTVKVYSLRDVGINSWGGLVRFWVGDFAAARKSYSRGGTGAASPNHAG
jgi:hypothetical protein